MSDAIRYGDDVDPRAKSRALRKACIGLAAYFPSLAVLMFLPAGRLDWTRGWVFLAVYLGTMIAATTYLWRTNPEVVVARSKSHVGAKNWDTLPFYALIGLYLLIFPVAGLDDGRFHRSPPPLALCLAGYALFLLGTAGIVWVLRVNKFAEGHVRIQTDRGHTVVDTGPYAIVRHPFYVNAFLMAAGMPLALGSYWALIPGGIAVLVLVVRTALEDRTLQRELQGYKEYAARVRYRLLPGVW
jgi:protein-S-isoprenylcysteine O-methyltransferase Ste14